MYKKIIISITILLMVGCQKNPNLQATPSDTVTQLFKALTGDLWATDDTYYEDYVKLFNDYGKDNATRENFTELRNILQHERGMSDTTFEIMKSNSGQMLLIHFVPRPEEDKYEIYNIYVVPDEIKEYFENIMN